MIDLKKVLDQMGTFAPEDEGREESLLVCVGAGETTPYTDNVFTTCHICETPLQHRPHVPKGARPTCFPCVRALVADQKSMGEEVKMAVTEKTRAEVLDYLKKQNS